VRSSESFRADGSSGGNVNENGANVLDVGLQLLGVQTDLVEICIVGRSLWNARKKNEILVNGALQIDDSPG
jgi:hypothetical protein